ncbi:MAG: branched-chain amino acid ABC transporter permease [Dehalococcoidia bacterium]|nr:branched-chain amino acid ABC transporter permease [Dehalococcoidia bacterium]
MATLRSYEFRRNWFVPLLVVAGIVYLLAPSVNVESIPAIGKLVRPAAGLAVILSLMALVVVAAAYLLGPLIDRGKPYERGVRVLGYALIIGFFLFMPLYVEDLPHGSMLKMTVAVQFMMVIIGINLLTGFGGQISLGQSAFFAIGGYSLAIMFREWGTPWGWSLLVGPLLAGGIGFLVGLPALRFKGPYLALATLSLAVTVSPLAKKFEDYTGGVQGVAMFGKLSIPFWKDNPDRFFYYLTALLALLLFVFAANLRRGRFGRALIAIRDNETAAASMGVNVALYKMTVFGIAGAFAGLAGALNGVVIQFVSPDQYSPLLSIRFFVGAVIGGVATIQGAVIGGLFQQFIPDVTLQVNRSAPDAIQAAILIIVMYTMRNGVVGFLQDTWRYARSGVQLRKQAIDTNGSAPPGATTEPGLARTNTAEAATEERL